MNDILAPIFVIFVAEMFEMNYVEMENNLWKVESQLVEGNFMKAEADAFHCFSLFLSTMKQNYTKGFDGVTQNIKKVQELLIKADKQLCIHFEENGVELYHFVFRWCFCLLLREIPITLAIKLMDHYLTEEYSHEELCIYLILGLLLRFSCKLKTLHKEQIIIFLQNLPTVAWGDQDIKLLVSESFTLRSLLKIN